MTIKIAAHRLSFISFVIYKKFIVIFQPIAIIHFIIFIQKYRIIIKRM